MNYTMTQEQLEQLARIYNTLAIISTKGEDTIVMGNCLQAFKTSLEALSEQVVEEKPVEEKE